MVTGVVAAVLGLAAQADAAALPEQCTPSGSTVSCRYSTGIHDFVVPVGVTSLTVTAVGGYGESTEVFARGGRPDRVRATLAVTPGEDLGLAVAGNGIGQSGGFNGGGDGCSGGGGASDVRRGMTLASRVIVAAGGGGAGCGDSGGAGGAGSTDGQPGHSAIGFTAEPGRAGTQTEGGAGGRHANVFSPGAGLPGRLAEGGDAGTSGPYSDAVSGGGGGAGLYGGGAGGSHFHDGFGFPVGGGAGGGGGSSLVPPGGERETEELDAPGITISYTAPPSGSADLLVASTVSPTVALPGSTLNYRITVTNYGPNAAQQVVLTSLLGGATRFVSATGPVEWSCTRPPVGSVGTVNCRRGGLLPGQTSVINVSAKAVATPKFFSYNRASVTSAVSDPDLSDNIATAAAYGSR